MRSVIYSMMVSLDGFIEGPNGELDWPVIDEELHNFINDQQRAIDTYLYGRRTYELMADAWPTAGANPDAPEYEVQFARIWKKMPKVVFSKTLDEVGWNSRLVRDNIAGEIGDLKAQPGKDLAIGGPTIASSFIELGLIDVYGLYVHPVVLGNGTPMFLALDNPLNLRLVDRRQFGSGVVYLRYRPADDEQ